LGRERVPFVAGDAADLGEERAPFAASSCRVATMSSKT
jgi:hypothetical protein